MYIFHYAYRYVINLKILLIIVVGFCWIFKIVIEIFVYHFAIEFQFIQFCESNNEFDTLESESALNSLSF